MLVRACVLVSVLGVLVACGGDAPPADKPTRVCDVGGTIYDCNASVLILRDAGGGATMSEACSTAGCNPGDRCVVVAPEGVREGTCR